MIDKQARNDYVRIRRGAQKNSEKDIIVKSTEQPKLFYSYTKGKSKVKENIQSLTEEGKNFVKDEEICEILNNNFQAVFTEERPFEAVNEQKMEHNIENINFGKKEIVEEMKDLNK